MAVAMTRRAAPEAKITSRVPITWPGLSRPWPTPAAATGLIGAGEAADEALAALAAGLTVPRIRAQVAAAQVAGAMRVLTGANVIRQAAGLSAEQTEAQSRAETTAAFGQLESGLGSFGA